MVIQTLSKIEDWDNSRCSTSGLTSSKKKWKLYRYISLLHGFPGTVTTWMMWFPNNSMIQNQHLWSQDAFQIPLRNTTSREIIFLSNGLRSKGQDIMAGFWPSENVSFINSSYLSPQKKTKYPNILISWYPWVVSCTYTDSKAMSGSGSGCGVRSAIALPAWESQETSLVETTVKP